MIIKLTYGLRHSLPVALHPRNFVKAQPSNVSFHYQTAPPCISLPNALAISKDGTAVEDKEILLDMILSSNSEVVRTILTLSDIGFLKAADEIEINAYVPNEANYKDYEELDIKQIRKETGHMYTSSTTYRIEGESALTDILKSKKLIKSKTWNTAGEVYDEDDNVVSIKPQKPVDFKELRNLIKEVCSHITDEDYQHIMKNCVEIKSGNDFSEDGDGWRDFSWYEVRMVAFEETLDKLGYLNPFLRKIAVDSILAELE